MEIARILDTKESGLIYGLMGETNVTTNRVNTTIITDYKFRGTVKEYLNSSKDISSLKMVLLREEHLAKKSTDLSEVELKKVSLAKSLIDNKDNIVLDYFEKGMNAYENKYFKNLFKRLTKDFHKTILIYTNDLEYLWDITNSITTVLDGNILREYKKSEYFNIEGINSPKIVRFTNLIRNKGINIEDYKDCKDLLKAIYRIKEQEKCDI